MYNELLLREVISWQVPNAQIKLIMCILADHTDPYGVCYPSIDRLTKLGCMSRSSTIRALNWLVNNNIIERHSGGKGRPSLYQFVIVKEDIMTKKSSVSQTHKGNSNIINLEEYISPSGVTQTLPFDDFWSIYPRKVSKGHARLAFKKACAKVGAEIIIDAVKKFSIAVEGKEKQYIPHPTTWLNGERWDDNIEDVSPATKTNTDRLKDILVWDMPDQIEDKQ